MVLICRLRLDNFFFSNWKCLIKSWQPSVFSEYDNRMKTLNKLERFLFVPHVKNIHEWEYSNNNYYRQVLPYYFKRNPYVDPSIVYNTRVLLLKQLQCLLLTKTKREMIQFKTNTLKYGYQSMAVEQLCLLFVGSCNSNTLSSLNKYSEAVSYYVKYGDAMQCIIIST